ncbi:MAG: DNA-directed RNA polymerase subunit P [Candidatus Aenigmarchaeota archaeon]|nr:DNA-directed RNA polymerase subunit P [Candidatus Aenigmarchaeota archaeon]
MYRCIKCKKTVAKFEERIRCPYCGGRIFIKLRPRVIKRVQAR